jgi:hypothetical protein
MALCLEHLTLEELDTLTLEQLDPLPLDCISDYYFLMLLAGPGD